LEASYLVSPQPFLLGVNIMMSFFWFIMGALTVLVIFASMFRKILVACALTGKSFDIGEQRFYILSNIIPMPVENRSVLAYHIARFRRFVVTEGLEIKDDYKNYEETTEDPVEEDKTSD
jgi:hypothetical protein